MIASLSRVLCRSSFFFFNDTATTEIYTLSLHDALPISRSPENGRSTAGSRTSPTSSSRSRRSDRKSTRLNSSHQIISYAVFCLKKKKTNKTNNKLKVTSHFFHPSDFLSHMLTHLHLDRT